MVLQGKEEEEKRWSVPSGGLEKGETLEECCFGKYGRKQATSRGYK